MLDMPGVHSGWSGNLKYVFFNHFLSSDIVIDVILQALSPVSGCSCLYEDARPQRGLTQT